MMKTRVVLSIFAVLMFFVASGLAMILEIPNTFDGIVFFDRWGGCYLYSHQIFDVSAARKGLLNDYKGGYASLYVTNIYQVTIPGDVRLEEFTVQAPGKGNEISSEKNEFDVEVTLDASAPNGVVVHLLATNLTDRQIQLSTSCFELMVFAKKPKEDSPRLIDFVSVSNGPSYALVNGVPIYTSSMPSEGQTSDGTRTRGKQHASWRLLSCEPHTTPQLSEEVVIAPHGTLKMSFDCSLSEGEYEILFGYDTHSQAGKLLMSNRTSVNVSADEHCEIVLPETK